MSRKRLLLNILLLVALALIFLFVKAVRSEEAIIVDELTNIKSFCELSYPVGTNINTLMYDYCVERQKEHLEKTKKFYEEWDLMVMTQRNKVAGNIYTNCMVLATKHDLIDYSLMNGCIESSIMGTMVYTR
jgi:hypothetical protein